MTRGAFVASERLAQAAFFASAVPAESLHPAAAYRLAAGRHLLNLAPAIRDAAESYFGPPRNITWHRHASHGLSSQACCLNFLMPLAAQPKLLARLIETALGLKDIAVLPIGDAPGHEPSTIAFEWIGEADYLAEWPAGGNATRGANVTSADAAVTFRRDGRIETVLIEWKYTEAYGAPLDPRGNPTRIARYADKAFAPNGPLRADLGLTLEDFFWEPFYQLLRQQMLAWRMEAARENGAERVSVLHISPAGNTALHRVTSPRLGQFGDDVFAVFRGLLAHPDRFVSVSTEQLFGPLLALDHVEPAAAAWASYLRERYRFLSTVQDQNG